jgi:prepilin-type N-terminal cleavage/methylation domain-containing protein
MNVPDPVSSRRNTRGFSLAEVLVATALAGMVAAMVMGAFMYSATSFSAMGNYSDLDRNSRNAVDMLGREIRNSSALLSFSTNAPKFMTFTNVTKAQAITVTYDSVNHALTLARTGLPTLTLLTQCDQWDFSLYSKAPNISTTNVTFYGATNSTGVMDVSACKLVNMTWRCSRTIFGSKRNTESIQTAEIVLRNKVN